jgi:hypothetical protein
MTAASRGADAVVHLAGTAGEAPFETTMRANVEGTYVTLEAARRCGVPRVILASSVHAVGYHPSEATPAPDLLFPRPDTFYGVSKVATEALGSLYHDRYGLDVIALRIVSCAERPPGVRGLSTWLSPDDAGRLFEAALTCPSPGFRVVWGVSANTRGWFSLEEARAIGYQPRDDAESFAEEIMAAAGSAEDPSLEHLGGGYATGDLDPDRFFARRSLDTRARAAAAGFKRRLLGR